MLYLGFTLVALSLCCVFDMGTLTGVLAIDASGFVSDTAGINTDDVESETAQTYLIKLAMLHRSSERLGHRVCCFL